MATESHPSADVTPRLQQNIVEERSWINATLLWAAGTMGISQASVNDLNMTNGVSQSARSSFQVPSSLPLTVQQELCT